MAGIRETVAKGKREEATPVRSASYLPPTTSQETLGWDQDYDEIDDYNFDTPYSKRYVPKPLPLDPSEEHKLEKQANKTAIETPKVSAEIIIKIPEALLPERTGDNDDTVLAKGQQIAKDYIDNMVGGDIEQILPVRFEFDDWGDEIEVRCIIDNSF